jgi:hypothetical protein
MRWKTVMRLRLRSLFSRARVEHELDEELRYHLEGRLQKKSNAAGVLKMRVTPRSGP